VIIEGCEYLSLKLDDPSFNVPIFANLFDIGDAESVNDPGRAAAHQ
jgi:uncharacterized protein (DUF736 family)